MLTKLSAVVALALVTVPFVAACSSATGAEDDVSAEGIDEALGGGGHYCPAPYTGGHSSSPKYMYSGAHAAMLAAGVGDGSLTQTFGDASASVGTHCPEPGASYSDATDITPGSNACARVHALRMQGFAAWYRVPAEGFGYHIHAVYSGAPKMKSSLKNQLASFYQKRNGLRSNTIEKYCPITSTEIAAVKAVASGHSGGESCVPGGFYCGGDKVSGDKSTLYKCDNDGQGASKVEACARGCSVNSGSDDSCRTCMPGGTYCGGDRVTGNPNNLYLCQSSGAPTLEQTCKHGCSVNSGADDSCK